MSSLNLTNLIPDLPDFEWDGKTYIALKRIFDPATRGKYILYLHNSLDPTKPQQQRKTAITKFTKLLSGLFPEAEKDGLFSGKVLPEDVYLELTRYIGFRICGKKYYPSDSEWEYDYAVQILEKLLADRATLEGSTREETLIKVRGEIAAVKK